MKKNILEKIRLSELSLVDRGANQHAAVTICKRDSDEVSDEDADILGAKNPVNKGETALTDKTVNVEEITKPLEDVTKKLEETQAALAKAEAFAKLSDAEKAFMDRMDEKERAAFMEMDEEKRKARMSEMKKNDETITVDGRTVSKSAVGDEQFAIMKRLAAAEEAIAKANEATELARLEKRAADELGNLPGTDVAKAKVLKALDSMASEEAAVIKSALEVANKASAENFETLGKSAGEREDADIMKRAEVKADEIAKRDGISKAAALGKVWIENPSLYAEYSNGKGE